MPHTRLSLHVTFTGYIASEDDAQLLMDMARAGRLPRVTRRMDALEKQQLVKSGSVFVYNREESGMERWTDGRKWSSSVTQGQFLVSFRGQWYRLLYSDRDITCRFIESVRLLTCRPKKIGPTCPYALRRQ